MTREDVVAVFIEEEMFDGRPEQEAAELAEELLRKLPLEIPSGTMVNIPTEYGAVDLDDISMTTPSSEEIAELDAQYNEEYGIDDTSTSDGLCKIYPGEAVFSVYVV